MSEGRGSRPNVIMPRKKPQKSAKASAALGDRRQPQQPKPKPAAEPAGEIAPPPEEVPVPAKEVPQTQAEVSTPETDTREEIAAKVEAARQTQAEAEEARQQTSDEPAATDSATAVDDDAAAQLELRRQEVMARVEAARRAQAGVERGTEETRQDAPRKLTDADLFGVTSADQGQSSGRSNSSAPDVKDYRMQGNYGATKFIKP